MSLKKNFFFKQRNPNFILFIRTFIKSAIFLLSEESQKKLLMQIYYVNHCKSYYTPLGILGVIKKLN